jgi:hypothetical protein
LYVGAPSRRWPAFAPPRWPVFAPPLTFEKLPLQQAVESCDPINKHPIADNQLKLFEF